jgi:hypothetical protein
MKTMKLIVLCLSLFLVSHSIFAQSSEKQAKYDKLIQKMAFLNDTIKKLEFLEKNNNLNEKQKADLKFYQDWRDVLENQIQKLFAEMVKEAVGGIPIQNVRQEIQEWTEDLYARKISVDEYWRRIERLLFDISNRQSAYNYAYDFFENKSNEISNNTKGYDSKIANYDSEMKNIIDNLSNKVYEMTNLKVNIKNMQKDPNNPYAFSNAVNTIYQKEKGKTLPNSTKQEIQQTYDVAASIYANRASEKEKLVSKKENAKNQYSYNQDVLKKLRSLCPECK